MPQCKNDPSRYYSGDEPSPKGKGYCAHGENIGTKKNGKDGNKWIVTKTKNGVKRWIKFNKLPSKVTTSTLEQLSLEYAKKNIDKDQYKWLITKQKKDFNLLNYIDIKINRSKKKIKINFKLKKNKHPEYTKVDFVIISSGKTDKDYIDVKYTQKKLNEMTKKNKFSFELDNIKQKKINFLIVLSADKKKYPGLLDIELSKKFKV